MSSPPLKVTYPGRSPGSTTPTDGRRSRRAPPVVRPTPPLLPVSTTEMVEDTHETARKGVVGGHSRRHTEDEETMTLRLNRQGGAGSGVRCLSTVPTETPSSRPVPGPVDL